MSRSALIVAHGQPSDPAPAEAGIELLAQRVASHLPGWRIGSATLAAPGSLAAALARLDRPTVFPFFMSDGFFISTVLPRRLAEADADDLAVLTPFGLMPRTRDLALAEAAAACRARGWAEAEATLILAAHGSGVSRRPADAAAASRDHIAARSVFRAIRIGFIEEPPFITDALRDAGDRAICLPLFAARWGHVLDDLPQAAADAGFAGAMLDPIGQHPSVPALIARAIASGL